MSTIELSTGLSTAGCGETGSLAANSGGIPKPSGNYVNIPVILGLLNEEYNAYKVSKNNLLNK
jgi:hypothetical protein